MLGNAARGSVFLYEADRHLSAWTLEQPLVPIERPVATVLDIPFVQASDSDLVRCKCLATVDDASSLIL